MTIRQDNERFFSFLPPAHAETEATCIRKVSPQMREISKSLYYECQVRGSFCERSEEYDVKSSVVARWQ